jgi:hypothetical protein
MHVQDPSGPWVRPEGARFLAAAREGEAPRYRLVPEGRDDDGDGRFNEDGPGGVCLDQNFPVGWRGAWSGGHSGQAPLSEPLARTYADLVLKRKTPAVVLFQGSHGGLATPGGLGVDALGWELPATRHRPVFEYLAQAFEQRFGRGAGRARSLREARHGERPGAALDWFYASGGALAVEAAPWGPAYPRNGKDAVDARYPRNGASAEERVSPEDREWGRWLDNTRGGLGFVEWHPVELGGGVQGLVGGWRPLTRCNPPVEELASAVGAAPDFALDVARALPRLEIEVRELSRDGEVVRLRARVKNRGALPSGVSPAAVPPAEGCTLELVLPAEARLLAGPERTVLGHLPGAGLSAEVEWLVQAPAGARLRLRAEDRLTAPVRIEVQP